MGKSYPMMCHGFAKSLPWKEIGRNADNRSARVTVELAASDATRESYPFAFHLDATYELIDGHLTIDYVVKSDASNSGPMPFPSAIILLSRSPSFREPIRQRCSSKPRIQSNCCEMRMDS